MLDPDGTGTPVQTDGLGEGVGLGLGEGLGLGLGEGRGLGEGDGEGIGVVDGVGFDDGEGAPPPIGLELGLGFGSGLGLGFGSGLGLGLGFGSGLGLGLGFGSGLGLGFGSGLGLGLGLGSGLGLGFGSGAAVGDGDGTGVGDVHRRDLPFGGQTFCLAAFSGDFPGGSTSGVAMANPLVNTNRAVTTAVTKFAVTDRSRFAGRGEGGAGDGVTADLAEDPAGDVSSGRRCFRTSDVRRRIPSRPSSVSYRASIEPSMISWTSSSLERPASRIASENWIHSDAGRDDPVPPLPPMPYPLADGLRRHRPRGHHRHREAAP